MEEFDPAEYGEPSVQLQQVMGKMSPQDAFIQTAKIFAPAGVGVVLIVFGLYNTGSVYTSASQFHGVLADVFYGWQAGNLMAMVGCILIYDAVKRSGYL
jgi:hypothetical protein